MNIFENQMTDYLLTQSWQIALLATIIGLIAFVLRNKSAHARYLLWLIVLAKCLVPPIYSVPVAVLPERTSVEHSTLMETPLMPIENTVATETPKPVTTEKISQPHRRQFELPNMKQTIVLSWLAGMALFLMWVGGRAVRYTLWLRNRQMSLPPTLDRQFHELFAGFKFRKSPKIWLASDIAQPFVWGLFRGSVYLPADFTGLDKPQHHRTVLVHELSHIARFDAAVNVLQILAQAIFWFHPFVWWVNKKIRREREKCCDEMSVVHLSTPPENYTDAIVEALAAERRSAHPIPSLAIVGSIRDIEERIKTMLKPGKKFYKRPSFKFAIVLVLLAVLIVPISCTLTHRAKTEDTTEQAEKSSISLFEAVEADDLEEVKRLIAEGADVNAKNNNGQTPLDVLLQRTPNQISRIQNHEEIVKLLIANGAEITSIHNAGKIGNMNKIKMYMDQGIDINSKDNDGLTPLDYAVRYNKTNTVKFLLDAGADVNTDSYNEGRPPLLYAVMQKNTEVVKMLVEHGSRIKVTVYDGFTITQYAAGLGCGEMVKLFISKGVDTSSFHMAACAGDLERVKSFVEQGTDVNTKDKLNWPPLFWATLTGQEAVVEYLLDNGADIFITLTVYNSPWGPVTPLHLAAQSGSTRLVELLISKGADVNALSRGRNTPLFEAANRDIAEILIANNADVNAKNGRGQTPLLMACLRGNKDLVELLITKGVDINAEDRRGQTALDLAISEGHTEIIELLKKHGAKE